MSQEFVIIEKEKDNKDLLQDLKKEIINFKKDYRLKNNSDNTDNKQEETLLQDFNTFLNDNLIKFYDKNLLKLQTENTKLQTKNSELQTKNNELQTQNSKAFVDNTALITQNNLLNYLVKNKPLEFGNKFLFYCTLFIIVDISIGIYRIF